LPRRTGQRNQVAEDGLQAFAREMTKMTRIRAAATASAALAAMIAAAPLAAADQKGESPYLSALRVCQAETDAAARLACYDAEVRTLLSASSEGEMRVVDKAEVRETRRKLFGFALPDFGIFGGKGAKDDDAKAQEASSLQTTIAGVRSVKGMYVITTAEGAVWQLDEQPARLMSPKIGQPLDIRAGSFGSFFLRINDQKGVKGRRVR